MAELPAENGAAGQWEAQSVGPEGVGSLLPVSPQDDSYFCLVKEGHAISFVHSHGEHIRLQKTHSSKIHFIESIIHDTCADIVTVTKKVPLV